MLYFFNIYNCFKNGFFCQDNCQKFLGLQVNPQICQDNKSLLKYREARGSWTQGVLLHWYEGWDKFTYVKQSKKKAKPKYTLQIRKKKNLKKKSTTLEVKTSSFYWSLQSGDVSSTPSTCQVEGIFGLGWPDWACFFKGPPLTTGWWDPAVCHEP
jgi:hypothetical protein